MGKCINFSDFTTDGNNGDATLIIPSNMELGQALESMEAVSRLHQGQLEIIDGYARDAIQKAGIQDISFQMAEQSKIDVAENCDGVMDGYYIYHGTDKDGVKYALCVAMEPYENGVQTTCGLYRISGTVAQYDFPNHKWDTGESFQTVWTWLQGGGIEMDVILALAEGFGLFPLFIHPDKVIQVISENKEIINFYREIHWLAMPVFMDDTQILLVPDDPCRVGSAIAWDGNSYCLYQYYTEDDDYDAVEAEDFMGFDEEDSLQFSKLVYSEPSIKVMKKAAMFMWDHYTGSRMAFQFPLSDKAYAETSRPYNGQFRVCTKYGQRKLTGTEKNNYYRLKKEFRGRREDY